MTPDALALELAMIVESVCAPIYNRETGLQEPISREDWLLLKEKFDLLCAENTPRVSAVI